jgi:hypothetical protein
MATVLPCRTLRKEQKDTGSCGMRAMVTVLVTTGTTGKGFAAGTEFASYDHLVLV